MNSVELNLFRPTSRQPLPMTLLDGETAYAGTAASCKVSLTGPQVAPFHCLLACESGVLVIQNCDTGGQLLVNNCPIESEVRCQGGDEILIGQNRIVVCCPATADTAANTDSADSERLSPEKKVDSANLASQPFSVNHDSAFDPDELHLDSDSQCHRDSDCNLDSPWYELTASDDLEEGASNNFNSDFSDAELELLKSEIEYLQAELAARDQQILEINHRRGGNLESFALNDENELIDRMTTRMEELLVEMQLSDDRIRFLEDLLQASDEATHAEKDERRQLESWLSEVESRVLQREGEIENEIRNLQTRCVEAEKRQKLAESQVKKILSKSTGQQKSVQHSSQGVAQLQQRLVQQERLLETAQQENEALQAQVQELRRADQRDKVSELEEKLVRMELQSSRERAELARQRAELEAERLELEKRATSQKVVNDTDCRLVAMRQHLREIHEEEKLAELERKQNSLGSRIARLLNKRGQVAFP